MIEIKRYYGHGQVHDNGNSNSNGNGQGHGNGRGHMNGNGNGRGHGNGQVHGHATVTTCKFLSRHVTLLSRHVTVTLFSLYRNPPSVSWDTSSVPVVIARIRGPMGYY